MTSSTFEFLILTFKFNLKVLYKVIHLSAFCLFLTIYVSPSFALQAVDEVTRIQKAYENIKDIKGNFTQKSYIKDLKRTDTYKGRFFIKPPKVKWEYKGDKPQVVYITGSDIIIYQKKEKQVFTSKFDRSTYGQAPIALLSGFGNIDKEFDVSDDTLNSSNRLILKPKKPMGNISQIELSLSGGEFPIESLTIIDALSNRVDIYLTDVGINAGLKDKMFEFYLPEDATLFQQ